MNSADVTEIESTTSKSTKIGTDTVVRTDTVVETDTMTETVIETQRERTDLPLVVMPVVFGSMIAPFAANFPLLRNIARVRMYTDFTLDENTIVNRIGDADAVIVIGFHITDSMFQRLSASVSCFAFGGTGVASYINLERAQEQNIRVTNVVHYGDNAVAEHTLALILELSRHVGTLNTQLHRGVWASADGVSLHGKTIGIAGFGGIGQTVTRMALSFGMKPLVWNSHANATIAEELGVTLVDDLADLCRKSDILSIHLPLNTQTEGIITAAALEQLRSGSMLINTARAEVIAREALLNRLREGDLFAGLDVFDHEPLLADDPLLAIPGVVVTPHVAWRSDEAYAHLTRQVCQSVVSYYEGGTFNAVV